VTGGPVESPNVEIDPNVRVHGNQTYAGLEDASGPLVIGQRVSVSVTEAGVSGWGEVTGIDPHLGLVYLAVDWASLTTVQVDPHPFGSSQAEAPAPGDVDDETVTFTDPDAAQRAIDWLNSPAEATTVAAPPKVRTHSLREVVYPSGAKELACDGCRRYWPTVIGQIAIEAQHCIPDLEFLPPDCPICGEGTDYADGELFQCERCEVFWQRDGTDGTFYGDEPDDLEQPRRRTSPLASALR